MDSVDSMDSVDFVDSVDSVDSVEYVYCGCVVWVGVGWCGFFSADSLLVKLGLVNNVAFS